MHVSVNFYMMDCNVSKAVIESNKELGIWYVTGMGLNLMFQVGV